ncbi:MAG: SOS response-associated peptidase [Thermomicrobiales bacterium]
MCGRYVIYFLPEEIHERFQLRHIPRELFHSFNAAPTQGLPVVWSPEAEAREVATMRWGLVPRWSRPGLLNAPPAPFNARAESLAEKPMFRSLIASRRCLVPANGYYEWRTEGGKKQPYYFSLPGEPIFSFAGLYDEIPGDADAPGDPDGPRRSFTVVTTRPNDLTAGFHHRMPVILARGDEEEWLSRDVTDPRIVDRLLLNPYPADRMAAHPVSPAVGNVRVNDPSLIESVGRAVVAEEADSDVVTADDDAPQHQSTLF